MGRGEVTVGGDGNDWVGADRLEGFVGELRGVFGGVDFCGTDFCAFDFG